MPKGLFSFRFKERGQKRIFGGTKLYYASSHHTTEQIFQELPIFMN